MQLCLEISVSSNSHNFLCMFLFKLKQPLAYFCSSFTVLYTVKKKEGKPDRKPYPSLWCKKSKQRTFKILPRNLNEIVLS
jgi:hypothetical protein